MDRLRFTLMILATCATPAATAPRYTISSVAGSDLVGDGGPAALAQLAGAEGIAIDAAGNVYLSDSIDHRIRKVSPSGVIATLAGNGHAGFKGDNGPASAALLNSPYGLAVDPAGNLYVADLGNRRVRRISPDGIIRTVVGGGQSRPGAGGGDPLASTITPRNVAVAPDGTLYVSDFADHRIYKIAPDARISLVAGTGVPGAGQPEELALTAQLNAPAGLALDAAGALYVADSGNHRVRKIERGRIATVAGGERSGSTLSAPTAVVVDSAGNLYIADSGNRRVARQPVSGAPTSFADFGDLAPRDLVLDRAGALCVAARRRVLKLSPLGQTMLFAGNGSFGYLGDGGAALDARLYFPAAVAIDAAGNLLIADQRNYRIRRVDSTGRITTVAGSGVEGSGGDAGPATLAQLITPAGVAWDPLGRVWIGDEGAHRVRVALPGGVIETAAGTGARGSQGDGGSAPAAQLFAPAGIAVDPAGNVFVADAFNHRVRRISTDGRIWTAAGRGVRGYGGDGGPAVEAQLDTPRAVAVDAAGNLYIAEYGNHCVRRVNREGRIDTVAGAGLNHPLGIAVDADGNLFIADSGNHRVCVVDANGVITTIAGDGNPGFAGDGGPATVAQLYSPAGLAAGPDGEIYVADFWNHRVRKLTPLQADPVLTLSVLNAASLTPGPVAPGELVTLLVAASQDAQVLFDGAPSPIFSVDDSRINTQVPYRLAAQTEIEVRVRGVAHARATVVMAPAAPGLFTVSQGKGQALAVNEDGTLNTDRNPAPRGSVVVLYATGEGISRLPAAVTVAGFPAEILYAGAAPGFPGLMQLNVRLPSSYMPPGFLPVALAVGPTVSQPGVTLAVK